MSSYDLRLAGGDAVLPGTGPTPVDVLVRDGRIAALIGRDEPAEARTTIDCRAISHCAVWRSAQHRCD